MSKCGIEGLTQILAAELESISAIRVNALNPGRARTRMRRQAYPAEELESLPEPATLMNPYLALLGPASRGVTRIHLSITHTANAAAAVVILESD